MEHRDEALGGHGVGPELPLAESLDLSFLVFEHAVEFLFGNRFCGFRIRKRKGDWHGQLAGGGRDWGVGLAAGGGCFMWGLQGVRAVEEFQKLWEPQMLFGSEEDVHTGKLVGYERILTLQHYQILGHFDLLFEEEAL